MHTTFEVSRSSPGQIADLLALTFQDDPFIKYVVGGEATDTVPFFRAAVDAAIEHGRITHTVPAIVGAALALGPSAASINAAMATPLPEIVRRTLTASAYERLTEHLHFMSAIHRSAMPGDHWYISCLGVLPTDRGAGIGSQLVERILSLAAPTALPTYLETSQPLNLPLYYRHGFTIARQGTTPYALDYWTMIR